MNDLIVDQFGAALGRHSERLRVTIKGELVQEIPLLDLQQVLITSNGVTISSDAVRDCAGRGIPIHFLTFGGRPYATVVCCEMGATVDTRRQQLMAFADSRGAALARAFVAGKARNQAVLLKYLARLPGRPEPAASAARDAAAEIARLGQSALDLPGDTADALRPALLGLEGSASAAYWQALAVLTPARLNWPGRRTRGAVDPFNMALNYGYGILYAQTEQAALLAGLDPYAGFVHVDRAGKPSLVLDLVEEFRQTVVDRTVLGLANQGLAFGTEEAPPPEDGAEEAPAGNDEDPRLLLDRDTRRTVAERVLERLEATEHYEGKRFTLRHIMRAQAGHVATFVRGERPAYEPFVAQA
jgi:CRISPR-associated protein Cas1